MDIAFFHDIFYSSDVKTNHYLLLIGVSATLNLILFWQHPVIATLLFLCLAFFKYRVFPLKKELSLWFIFLLVGGIAEIFFVNSLHAWFYTKPDFLGIPFYMPFLWALLGTLLISFYEVRYKVKS